MPVSWKMEVHTGGNPGEWTSNNCAYATEREAEAAGQELLGRWFVPDDSRAVPSDQPVNAEFNFDRYKSQLLPEPAPAPVVDAACDLCGVEHAA